MLIGLNGQRILIDKPAGPEVYTINFFKALAKTDQKNKYVVYFTSEPDKSFWDGLKQGNSNFSYKVVPKLLSWTQVGLALELMKSPVDLFFTAVHTIPIIRKPSLKTVGMIHGLEYTHSAEYKNPLLRLSAHSPVKFVAKKSDAIIVPSQATKDEILKRAWGVEENKITVVREGVNETFYKRSGEEIKNVREKYNLKEYPYLIFVSTIQPRKNIPVMVGAFSQALKEKLIPAETKLVIAGKLGWLYEESLAAPKKYGVEASVLFVGRVNDADLPPLLSGAKAFISCSLEEGFGLPLLEAMACEVPTGVSNIPPFREVGAEFPIYVDPKNIESIKSGIAQIFSQEGSQDVQGRAWSAKERANNFSWENTARESLKIFENVVEDR